MKKNQTSRGRVVRLHNATGCITFLTQGEIAVVKSMVKNDVKTPLNTKTTKQKSIGVKKRNIHHRSM